MRIQIDIPDKEVILNSGLGVSLAGPSESWSSLQLKEYRHMRGVYVIHHDNRIRYVGKTDGPTMTFGDHLRREFNYSAAKANPDPVPYILARSAPLAQGAILLCIRSQQ